MTNRKPTQTPRTRRTIKHDRVNARDFMKFDFIYACEQCSHFAPLAAKCTLGYPAQHSFKEQLERYERGGTMAFCRFQEID